MTLDEVLTVLRRLAPEDTALENDPIGLLIGRDNPTLTRIGVCLDSTPKVAKQAVRDGVQLVVAHHPLIYRPLKRLGTDPISVAVRTLVRADIGLYVMHTNWDRAAGGINDTLAECLELTQVQTLGTEGLKSLPRLGTLLCPRPPADFARFVASALGCGGTSTLRISDGDEKRLLSRIAVCGGAGAELAEAVHAAGADAYVTSDVRHHEFWDAEARGLVLLDAGHGATETPGMRALQHRLAGLLDGVEVIWVAD